MQENNSKIKPLLITKRITEHQRLNVEEQFKQKALERKKTKQDMLLLEKRLGNNNNKKI